MSDDTLKISKAKELLKIIADQRAIVEQWDILSSLTLIHPNDFELIRFHHNNEGLYETNILNVPLDRLEWAGHYVGKLFGVGLVVSNLIYEGHPEVIPTAGSSMLGFELYQDSQKMLQNMRHELQELQKENKRLNQSFTNKIKHKIFSKFNKNKIIHIKG